MGSRARERLRVQVPSTAHRQNTPNWGVLFLRYTRVVSKKYSKSLHIFRRDIRLEDNLGLFKALEESETVVPIFIFSQEQTSSKNEYFSENSFQFLISSLRELDERLKSRGSQLFVFEGTFENVISKLLKSDGVDAAYCNEDCTPFARSRDESLKDLCEKEGVVCEVVADAFLSDFRAVFTGSDKPYSVFTPFMKKAQSVCSVPKPRRNTFENFFTGTVSIKTTSLDEYDRYSNKDIFKKGGREEGLQLLRMLDELKEYDESRNMVAEKGTSGLSAHHKFGTISIRETYHEAVQVLGKNSQFISELYWRDFYSYISYHFPRVLGGMVGEKNESFFEWGDKVEWRSGGDDFKAWCEGKTGIPIVDAGMRQLNTIGWMHNRARMIVASFLTKDLLIDWREGERYFATQLVDYDPAVNNGSWQWGASVGADPRPLRIFNPYTQAEKYDPKAEYIKKWVPELERVPVEELVDGKEKDFSALAPDYVPPIVSHNEAYHRARDVYRDAK